MPPQSFRNTTLTTTSPISLARPCVSYHASSRLRKAPISFSSIRAGRDLCSGAARTREPATRVAPSNRSTYRFPQTAGQNRSRVSAPVTTPRQAPSQPLASQWSKARLADRGSGNWTQNHLLTQPPPADETPLAASFFPSPRESAKFWSESPFADAQLPLYRGFWSSSAFFKVPAPGDWLFCLLGPLASLSRRFAGADSASGTSDLGQGPPACCLAAHND